MFCKDIRKEIAFQIGKYIPLKIRKGPCVGMQLYGSLFYNRRRDELTDEEYMYENLDLKNKVVVQAGAHIGVDTMFFSRMVGSGRILAFEPNPANFLLLCKNIRENALMNVTPVNVGLSNEVGTLNLVSDRYNTAKGTFRPDRQELIKVQYRRRVEVGVPVTTVDKAVEEYSLERVDFVQIDTEGFEPQVIEGMSTTLENSKPLIYFEIHGLSETEQQNDLRRVFNFAKGFDYHLVRLVRDIPRLTEDNISEFSGGGYLAFFNSSTVIRAVLDSYTYHRDQRESDS